MRVLAAALAAVLLLVQPGWAYEAVVTRLTDQHFEPIIDEVLYGGSLESNTSRPIDIRLSDIQVATLTRRFSPEEIGQDFDAAVRLAKREAAKLGADLIFYGSGTEAEEGVRNHL